MKPNVSLSVVYFFSLCLLLSAQQRDDAVEVEVDDLEATPLGVSITLRASDSGDPRQAIHMMVGFPEGQSIVRAMNHEKPERPLAHDLFKSFMDRNGWHVQKVLIRALKNDTYLADLTLENDHETQIYDARPSDAMAIGLRYGAKIYVNQQVFEQQKQREKGTEPDRPTKRQQPDGIRL